jgi:hypothetical protein
MMGRLMTDPGRTSRKRRPVPPRSHTPVLTPDDLMEEVRQLRASVKLYRKLVERLLERQQH